MLGQRGKNDKGKKGRTVPDKPTGSRARPAGLQLVTTSSHGGRYYYPRGLYSPDTNSVLLPGRNVIKCMFGP